MKINLKIKTDAQNITISDIFKILGVHRKYKISKIDTVFLKGMMFEVSTEITEQSINYEIKEVNNINNNL